jgi:hypothetical protein
MRESHSGKSADDETRAKLSAARSSSNHHMYGQSYSAETRARMSAAKIGSTNVRSSIVTIHDTETDLTTTQISISHAAEDIYTTVSNILRFLHRKNPDKPFRGRYIITIHR